MTRPWIAERNRSRGNVLGDGAGPPEEQRVNEMADVKTAAEAPDFRNLRRLSNCRFRTASCVRPLYGLTFGRFASGTSPNTRAGRRLSFSAKAWGLGARKCTARRGVVAVFRSRMSLWGARSILES